jgi:hypothetical protein
MAQIYEIPVTFNIEAGDAQQAATTLRKLLAHFAQDTFWKERFGTVTMTQPPEDGSTAHEIAA